MCGVSLRFRVWVPAAWNGHHETHVIKMHGEQWNAFLALTGDGCLGGLGVGMTRGNICSRVREVEAAQPATLQRVTVKGAGQP